MSDQKPLRQEDYMAMAEENKRMKQASNPPSGQSQTKTWFKKTILYICILGVLGSIIFLFYSYSAHPGQRNTACYFIRNDSDAVEPWAQEWIIYRSDHANGANHRVIGEFYHNSTDAWNIIEGWHLTACK
jgi:hypothetical protein